MRASEASPATASGRARAAAAPPGGDRCDLSVVVVFHNMRREAARTLHSLSRAYQRGHRGSRLRGDRGRERLRRTTSGSARTSSQLRPRVPLPRPRRRRDALAGARAQPRHRGVARRVARADDRRRPCAHAGRAALRDAGPAHLRPGRRRPRSSGTSGPGQQNEAMDGATTRTTRTGSSSRSGGRRRLPAVRDRPLHRRPRLVRRPVGEQLHLRAAGAARPGRAVDESFSMPGGGFANLDLFERLAATPGVTVVGILGEGSFHQLHGGTTTNEPDVGERHARLMAYREHYEQIRKRPFRGPGKRRHYVGSVSGAARRTPPALGTPRVQARRNASGPTAFRSSRPGPRGAPARVHRTRSGAAWPGARRPGSARRCRAGPDGPLAYQELIARVRPDWIIEVGGGRSGAVPRLDLRPRRLRPGAVRP